MFARAVEVDHDLVDLGLLLGIEAAQGLEDLAIDGADRLGDALAEIAGLVAVAQLDRLMGAGGGAGRHGGAAERAIFQHDVDLDGGIAAAIEDFASDDVDDGGHGGLFSGNKGGSWRCFYRNASKRKRPGDGCAAIG